MSKLFAMIYILASPTLAGSAIVAALTVGRDGASDIIIASAVGAVLAIPVSWLISNKLAALR